MHDDPHHSSVRRIAVRAALLIAPLVALALVAPRVVHWLKHRGDDAPAKVGFERPPTPEELEAAREAERKLARAEKRWDGAAAITPSEAVPDDSGEKTRWFQGFGLSVESTPAGARVLVNGQDMGQTPLVTTVDCKPGDPVKVEVKRKGLRPQARSTRCREDRLVELSVELK
jgi:hypothetical protein